MDRRVVMKGMLAVGVLLSLSVCYAGFIPQKISEESGHKRIPTEPWGAKIVEFDVPQKNIDVSGSSDEDGFIKIFSGNQVTLMVPYLEDDDSVDTGIKNAVKFLNTQNLSNLYLAVSSSDEAGAELNMDKLREKVNKVSEYLSNKIKSSSLVIAPEIKLVNKADQYSFWYETGADAVFILKYSSI